MAPRRDGSILAPISEHHHIQFNLALTTPGRPRQGLDDLGGRSARNVAQLGDDGASRTVR